MSNSLFHVWRGKDRWGAEDELLNNYVKYDTRGPRLHLQLSEGVLLTHNCASELHTGRLHSINTLQDVKGNPFHSNCFSKYSILRGDCLPEAKY